MGFKYKNGYTIKISHVLKQREYHENNLVFDIVDFMVKASILLFNNMSFFLLGWYIQVFAYKHFLVRKWDRFLLVPLQFCQRSITRLKFNNNNKNTFKKLNFEWGLQEEKQWNGQVNVIFEILNKAGKVIAITSTFHSLTWSMQISSR